MKIDGDKPEKQENPKMNIFYVVAIVIGMAFIAGGLAKKGPYPHNYLGYWHTEYPEKDILFGLAITTINGIMLWKNLRRR